jgi:hypothetical protein
MQHGRVERVFILIAIVEQMRLFAWLTGLLVSFLACSSLLDSATYNSCLSVSVNVFAFYRA